MQEVSQSGAFVRLRAWLGLSTQAAPQAERRILTRMHKPFLAEIQGPNGRIPATGVDLHDRGVKLISKLPWAAGAVLFLDLKSLQLMGFAQVRHCTHKRGHYVIGLEFCSPLMQRELGTWLIERVCCPAE